MEEKQVEAVKSDSEKSSRREFMKKAGQLALYTPPAIMLLMQPNREAIACSPGQVRRRFRDKKRGRDGSVKMRPIKVRKVKKVRLEKSNKRKRAARRPRRRVT